MEFIAIGIIGFIILAVIMFPGGLGSSSVGSKNRYQSDQLLDGVQDAALESRAAIAARRRASDGSEEMDAAKLRKVEVSQRLDEIGNEPGGLLRFDTNGNGVLESQEMRVARVEVALELAAEKGGIPETEGVIAKIPDESHDELELNDA